MFPNYLADGKRCAVDLNSLKLQVSNQDALEILAEVNFEIIDVDLVELARGCIGKSTYRRGSPICKAPHQMDCSSFTKWLYAQKGIRLPRRSIQQREIGIHVEVSELLAGDLVFVSGEYNYFLDNSEDGVGHVGISTGQGTIVHAANSEVGIEETDIAKFVQRGFRGARRIIPHNSEVLTMIVPPERDVESSDDIRWIVFGLFRYLKRKL